MCQAPVVVSVYGHNREAADQQSRTSGDEGKEQGAETRKSMSTGHVARQTLARLVWVGSVTPGSYTRLDEGVREKSMMNGRKRLERVAIATCTSS